MEDLEASPGSNDAEVQSLVESEDMNFRRRMLGSEINGGGHIRQSAREDLVGRAEQQARLVHGILCTDFCGGFDAVERNESP